LWFHTEIFIVVAQAKREEHLLKKRNISKAGPLSDSNGKVKNVNLLVYWLV